MEFSLANNGCLTKSLDFIKYYTPQQCPGRIKGILLGCSHVTDFAVRHKQFLSYIKTIGLVLYLYALQRVKLFF